MGSLPLFDGQPLVILNETVRQIGEISGIVILFIAGLEITPREFLRGGVASFTVGACGVVVPFFVGYYVFTLFGLGALQSVLIATALFFLFYRYWKCSLPDIKYPALELGCIYFSK